MSVDVIADEEMSAPLATHRGEGEELLFIRVNPLVDPDAVDRRAVELLSPDELAAFRTAV